MKKADNFFEEVYKGICAFFAFIIGLDYNVAKKAIEIQIEKKIKKWH